MERGASARRPRQLGALHALCGHLSVHDEPEIATVVLPTGTGETETMLAALAYRRTKRLLIPVSSDARRQQSAQKIAAFGLLRYSRLPTKLHPSTIRTNCWAGGLADEAQKILSKEKVVVTLPDSIAANAPGAAEALIDGCDELFIDQAHRVGATRWQKIRDCFDKGQSFLI
ncbi:MAG: DEAD/DEAH box helicase family protein [Pseudomonadota bacterium]